MRIGRLAPLAGAPPGAARCSSVGPIDGALHARAALLRGGGRVRAAERLAGPGAAPNRGKVPACGRPPAEGPKPLTLDLSQIRQTLTLGCRVSVTPF